jgi:hypothetical protein
MLVHGCTSASRPSNAIDSPAPRGPSGSCRPRRRCRRSRRPRGGLRRSRRGRARRSRARTRGSTGRSPTGSC